MEKEAGEGHTSDTRPVFPSAAAAEILDIIPSYLPRLIQSLSLPPAEVRNAWQRQSGGGGKTENPNRYMDGRVIVSQQGKEAGYPLDSRLLPSVAARYAKDPFRMLIRSTASHSLFMNMSK